MLQNAIIQKLHAMRLGAMAGEFIRQTESADMASLTFEERFGMLTDAEWLSRENNRTRKLLAAAKLREPQACLENIDYDARRKLDRSYVARLSDLAWVKHGQNMILCGATGTGKTYLACAFGNAACRQGYKVRYYRVPRLLTDLAVGRGDGSYNRLLKTLKGTQLLILDDWGLSPLTADEGRDLLEVIEDRHGNAATLICSQIPVAQWHALYEDSTIADAILDRLVHNSHRFTPEGPSKRRDPPGDSISGNLPVGIAIPGVKQDALPVSTPGAP